MTRTVSRTKPRATKASSLHLLRQLAPRVKILKKGAPNRRVILDYTFGSYNYMFHATKGWRKRRA
jgi:hypothetical protein